MHAIIPKAIFEDDAKDTPSASPSTTADAPTEESIAGDYGPRFIITSIVGIVVAVLFALM